MSDQSSVDLRCSVQSRGNGELPGGSATAADRFILAELPQPWPGTIESHPLIVSLPPNDPALGVTRLLGIRRADEPNPVGVSKVLVYSRDPGTPFAGFTGLETDVAAERLGQLLATIAQGDHRDLSPINLPADGPKDVLLCTHGSRDRCCGQLGSLLFLELIDRLPANVRLWRASHTGGHRFAPTGVSFPDGLTWAFLDAHLLSSIVTRSAAPTDLHPHLRGCAGFDGPSQVADAAVFAVVGWSWIDQPRAAVIRELPNSSFGIEREVYLAGPHRQFTVTVAEDDPAPVPPCGEPIERATKSSPQYLVTSIVEH